MDIYTNSYPIDNTNSYPNTQKIASDDLTLSVEIAREIAKYNGTTMYVGGMVRDKLLGKESKDIDLEIYHITPQTLEQILSKFGKILKKGATFGVYGIEHTNLDIAMPRREHCIGTKHTDFTVSIDPDMSFREATMRRDLTINAMMENVITGEIIDLWNGQNDLKNKIIRHVNDKTFTEDPLRVFRVAQFAARFDATISKSTRNLCKNTDISQISKQRVFEELSKALLKAEKPSIFFETLKDMNHLKEFFPELEACVGIPQNPEYHPEGDVFNHTMMVIDEASKLKNQATEPLNFMLSAVFHDLGKAVTTIIQPDGKITAYEHDTKGVPICQQQIERLTDSHKITAYVINMAQLHMRPNMLADNKSKTKKTRMMFDASVCPEDLILLSKADSLGRKTNDYNPDNETFLKNRLQDYYEILKKPMLSGKDLIQKGFKPGPEFLPILTRARELHFAGLNKEEALQQIKTDIQRKEKQP